LETLKAGAARIDLKGDPVGTVTAADEEDAKRKIAKAARRAAAKAIEDRKAAGQPAAKPVAKCAGQISTAGASRAASRVGWPQGGRTGSAGAACRREVIQGLWPLDRSNLEEQPAGRFSICPLSPSLSI
jgi:sRNA-binding protein